MGASTDQSQGSEADDSHEGYLAKLHLVVPLPSVETA
jgi:hypothetical protein